MDGNIDGQGGLNFVQSRRGSFMIRLSTSFKRAQYPQFKYKVTKVKENDACKKTLVDQFTLSGFVIKQDVSFVSLTNHNKWFFGSEHTTLVWVSRIGCGLSL